MKINKIPKNNINYTSLNTNKFVLSGLEKVADHGASFAICVSFIGATVLRPFVISHTPKVHEENKKYLCANSIASGIMKLAVAEAVALPVENAVKQIDTHPDEFLNKKTLQTFFNDKKSYNFLTQALKQGANLLSAIPKSCLSVALVPFIFDKFLNKKPKEESINPLIFSGGENFSKFNNISFKGNQESVLSKGISKLINNETIQNLAKQHSKNDTNIVKNIAVASDILLIGNSALQTKLSKKIKEERKNPLIYNNILTGLLGIVSGCAVDKIVQEGSTKALENFKKIHQNNPKLPKYIEGINVLRPIVIFSLIYYGLMPFITTYLSDKLDKTTADNNK